MTLHTVKIHSYDEPRLMELLKYYEEKLETYSDEQLCELESAHSKKILKVLKNQDIAQRPSRLPTALRLPFSVKAGATAFFAAAALLLLQVRVVSDDPMSGVVTKGTGETLSLSCDLTVLEASGAAAQQRDTSYLIDANAESFLKVKCDQQVFIHIGSMQAGKLILIHKNLLPAESSKIVEIKGQPLNFTAIIKHSPTALLVATPDKIQDDALSPEQTQGLWMIDVPLKLK